MELTSRQKGALDALEWLTGDEFRREGRTTLVLVWAIRKAMQNPGLEVHLRDPMDWMGGGTVSVTRHVYVSLRDHLFQWGLEPWFTLDSQDNRRSREPPSLVLRYTGPPHPNWEPPPDVPDNHPAEEPLRASIWDLLTDPEMEEYPT